MSLKKLLPFLALALFVVLPGSVFAATKLATIPRNTLVIEVQNFETPTEPIAEGGSPKGHVVKFSGWFDLRFLVTHADGLRNVKLMPLVSGKDLARKGFYFAGVQDDLVFIRSGNTLQVQRETRDEMSTTPNTREPLFSMYLPATVKVQVR